MARKTIVELVAQAEASFPDNAVEFITPALLRQFCLDFLDTMRPAYAALAIENATGKAVTTTFTTFVWDTLVIAQAPEYTVSLASGTVNRSNGPASGRISFSIDVQAPNNMLVTLALFLDNVETAWATSNTSTSTADVQSYAFTAVTYSVADPIEYQIRIKGSTNGNVTLTNGVLVVENIPVNTN